MSRRLLVGMLLTVAGVVGTVGFAGAQLPRGPIIAVSVGNATNINVSGSGWIAGDVVTTVIDRAPTKLGTVTVAADGTFATAFAVPCSLSRGIHTVTATGRSGTSSSTITLRGCGPAGSVVSSRSNDNTGTLVAAGVGIVLFVAAGAVAVGKRRRAKA